MDRVSVESTHLKAVQYDEETSILRVWFRTGGVYEYHGVPKEIYHELVGSISVGNYFMRNIRLNYTAVRAGDGNSGNPN